MKKAKGVERRVVAKNVQFEDYYDCVFKNKEKRVEQKTIRSRLHVVRTEKQQKIGLSSHDDKRYIYEERALQLPSVKNLTDSLAWGDYRIQEVEESLQALPESFETYSMDIDCPENAIEEEPAGTIYKMTALNRKRSSIEPLDREGPPHKRPSVPPKKKKRRPQSKNYLLIRVSIFYISYTIYIIK